MDNEAMVTVVIPTKNPGNRFLTILEKVLHQKTSFDFEVCIIDSGSTDGTVEKIREKFGENIKLLSIDPKDFGHGKTRNYAISLNETKYTAMLTHDAEPYDENWLQELVNIAEEDSRIAGVFGRHIANEDATVFTKAEIANHFFGFKDSPVSYIEDKVRYKEDESYRQYLHFFSDNSSLIRRKAWEEVKYPDVNFAEDQIWAKMVLEKGWKKGYSHNSLIYHSHDYHGLARLRRSFDESMAFKKLFGYVLCSNAKVALLTWLALNRRDYLIVKKERVLKLYLTDLPSQIMDNLMKVLGYCIGSNYEKMAPKLVSYISYDNSLFLGKKR